MGFLSGDDDTPVGKYHEATWGGKVKDDRWSPDDWDTALQDDDGEAPWKRNSKGWTH